MYKLSRLAFLVSISSSAFAADRYYVGPTNGVWSDPNNWSATAGGPGGAGVPAQDHVFVQPFSPTALTLDANPFPSTLSLNGGAAPLTLNQTTDKTVDVTSAYNIGPGVSYIQSAGNNYAHTGLNISGTPAQPTTYSLTNAVLHIYGGGSSNLSGITFNQSSGFHTAESGGTWTNTIYHLDGGKLYYDGFSLKASHLYQTAGDLSYYGGISLENGSIWDFSGGTVQAGNTGSISVSSDSTINQSGGSVLPNSRNSAFISGTYNLSSGSLTANFSNSPISGIFNQTGGSSDFGMVQLSGKFLLLPEGVSTIDTLIDAATAQLVLEIDGTGASQFAHIALTSSTPTQLNGNLTVNLGPNYTPQQGDSFNLITGPSITGTFSSYTLPPLSPGLSWVVNQTPTVFNLSVATPEPTLAMMFLPLLLLRRSRRKAQRVMIHR